MEPHVILLICDYGSIDYHGYGIHGTKNDEKRVQMAQNVCIRYNAGISRFKRISPILNEMRKTLYNRHQFLSLCMLHNIVFQHLIWVIFSLEITPERFNIAIH